ncbi:tetratricopeptide repeat protein, partial [Candidatus Marithioploca araucensis]|nr:tetratricopeptide repeat protein [Candidatus Marithioploca araucensis]
EAGNHLQQAIALNPKFGLAYYNLGRVRQEQGQTDHALACWKRALEFLKPDDAKSYFKVGYMLKEQGKLTEAIAYYQEALTLEPDLNEAHAELGNTFKDKGLINEAIEHLRRLLEIKPTANAQTALLGTLNYSPDDDQAAIFSECKRFNEEYAIPLAASIKPHLNDRNPQRRLKIGYVSPDFRRHSVAKFIEPVLAHHDHEQYEIFCYYNHAKTDDVTQRLQEYADNWFNCVDMRSDEKLADRIRQDQIDILVDLAGHTKGDRLFVFAKKPAPIQVSYLGYPNTTGLTAIDYRITDAYRDPEETSEQFSSESLIRIPGYYCYNPTENSPPVNECPCIQNGYITFTSFNNYAKMNPTVLALWAEVLNTIADSKLLIKTKTLSDEATKEALKEQFAQLGIAPERLILEGWDSFTNYLKRYHQTDIGLDPYPYNGGTMTCEALWMGIPVVTLVGKTHASRMGLSILSTIGLTELIAYTPEEYVDICVKLANDTDYLQKLRAEIRERMQASPLMDGAGLTHQLEKEYRKMWEKWCAIETKFINH